MSPENPKTYAKATCLICSGHDIITIGKPHINKVASNYIHDSYQVVMCKSCRFYFVDPQIALTREQSSELYGAEYFGEMTRWWTKKRTQHRNQRINLMQSFLSIPDIKFLDVGCGEGLMLLDVLKKGWEAYGIDIKDFRINEAQGASVKFKKGDLFSAGYPNRFFDVIYLDSVLEHILNPDIYLLEIHRILKDNGILYIGVPNEDSVFNDFKKVALKILGKSQISSRIGPFKSPYHVIGFTHKSLPLLMKKSGFQIMHIKNYITINEWRMIFPLFSGHIISVV